MRENRNYKSFDVVGDAEIAPVNQREGLRRAKQSERSARTDAEFERVVFARLGDDLQQIINQSVVNAHVGGKPL